MSAVEDRLKSLGITLPTAPSPVANYLPFTTSGNLVFIAGQLPVVGGSLVYKGKVGADLDPEKAAEAAAICAINILAQAKAACGDLDRVARVVKLGGFVNAVETFEDHPAVINRASDLMAEVFGEAGRHARSAVGVGSLPLGAPVEIDAILETA